MSVNGIQKISKISGVSIDNMKDIWENVKKNHKKLNDCELHDFSVKTKNKMKFKCKNCNGIVDKIYKQWYEKGLKHARQSKN